MYLVQDANGYVWGSLSVIDDSRWFCPQLHLCLTGVMVMKLIDAMEKADRWVQRFEEFLHDNALAC